MTAEPNQSNHLSREPFEQDLPRTYAKLRGMGFMDAQASFTRDSKRLDARNKAVYAQLGLETKETPGELQMIADNIELDDAARADIFKRLDDKEMGDVRIVADNITFLPGGTGQAGAGQAQPTPLAPEKPLAVDAAPEDAQPTIPAWAKTAVSALAAAILGAGLVAPVAIHYGASDPAVQPAPAADTDTDTNTRGILELVPDQGQTIQ